MHDSCRNDTPHPASSSPAPRLFGQFLVDEGVIDAAALEEALDLMRLVNRTVGQLAAAHGYCTAEEADRVAALQRDVDGSWGEIAVAAGIGRLVPRTIETLLTEQAVNNLRLSDALVELGHASASEIDAWWSRYETEVGRTDTLGTLPEAYRGSPIVREVVRVLPRLAIRVLGRPMLLGSARPWVGGATQGTMATVELRGTDTLRVGMLVHETRQLSQRQLVQFLETVAWHATRRVDATSPGSARVCDPPESALVPEAGVAIELAIGNTRCTLVLALDAGEDSTCH